MKEFRADFTVQASLETLQAFYSSTTALRRLTPPPMWIQLHHVEPLAENSISRFTLWFLFIPLPWTAQHSQMSAHGFIDQQMDGPLTFWRHQHHYAPKGAGQLLVTDAIQYELPAGWRGLLLALFFNPLALRLLFFYRALATRFSIRHLTS